MKLKALQSSEITTIYQERMVHDFIRDDHKALQTRRIGFYKRNGCTDTGLRVKCFGVPFIILELDKSRIRSEAKLLFLITCQTCRIILAFILYKICKRQHRQSIFIA